MDPHAQRGLDEQRKLCRVENARVAVERERAQPIVSARHTVEAFDVIERLGRRTRTWRPLGQFYGCMGAAFAVKPTGQSGPLLVLKVVLNDPTHGGAARTPDEVIAKFQAEIKFTGDPDRLPLHENLPFCYGYFVAAARGLPELDWMEEYTECDTLCVVMEHIQGITLQSLAGQHHAVVDAGASTLFPEALLLSYCEQLLLAINHLKCHDIVHRDVKPDNVMVSGPFRQSLKVCPCNAPMPHIPNIVGLLVNWLWLAPDTIQASGVVRSRTLCSAPTACLLCALRVFVDGSSSTSVAPLACARRALSSNSMTDTTKVVPSST